jgi:hypothetical protein
VAKELLRHQNQQLENAARPRDAAAGGLLRAPQISIEEVDRSFPAARTLRARATHDDPLRGGAPNPRNSGPGPQCSPRRRAAPPWGGSASRVDRAAPRRGDRPIPGLVQTGAAVDRATL